MQTSAPAQARVELGSREKRGEEGGREEGGGEGRGEEEVEEGGGERSFTSEVVRKVQQQLEEIKVAPRCNVHVYNHVYTYSEFLC